MRKPSKRKYPFTKRPEYDELFHTILNRIRDRSNSALARDSFLSSSTFYKWRLRYEDGGTRYPRSISLQEAARLAGFNLELVPSNNPRPLRADVSLLPTSKRPKSSKRRNAKPLLQPKKRTPNHP